MAYGIWLCRWLLPYSEEVLALDDSGVDAALQFACFVRCDAVPQRPVSGLRSTFRIWQQHQPICLLQPLLPERLLQQHAALLPSSSHCTKRGSTLACPHSKRWPHQPHQLYQSFLQYTLQIGLPESMIYSRLMHLQKALCKEAWPSWAYSAGESKPQ